MSKGIPSLSLAEEEFWVAVKSFFANRFPPYFPKIPTPELSAEIFIWAERYLKDDLEQLKGSEFQTQMYEALRLLKRAREDKEYWHELYEKFRRYWEWFTHAPTDEWGRVIES